MIPRYVPSANGGMTQTQNGAYVAAADFDQVQREVESAKEILAEAVALAGSLMRQMESHGLSAEKAEKRLREAVISSQVAARLSR